MIFTGKDLGRQIVKNKKIFSIYQCNIPDIQKKEEKKIVSYMALDRNLKQANL